MFDTQQSIYQKYWKYTIPTIVAMLVSGLYQVIDGIFIGHYVGANGLAGINLAWPVIATVLGVGMLIGVGTGALSSLKQGEKEEAQARQALANGLLMLLVSTPIISLLLYLESSSFIAWQGADFVVSELATQYLDILVWACCFTLGSIALPFLLRNDDSPKLATALMVIGAVLNIGLDYLLIAHLDMALTGAALATAFSQASVTLLGLLYFISSKAKQRLHRADFKPDWKMIKSIAGIGLSSFFIYVYGGAMVAVHNGLLAHYGGMSAIGAYSILGYIVTVYFLIVEGLANGMQPLVSYSHGAGRYRDSKALLNLAMGLSVIGGLVTTLVLNLFPEFFIELFSNGEGELLDYATMGIRLHMCALFLDGFLFVAGTYYQSVGSARKATIVTLGNMLIQIPFLIVLPKLFDIHGVWLAVPLSNITLSIFVAWILYRDIKRLRLD